MIVSRHGICHGEFLVPANSVDEVIERLDEIIQLTSLEGSRLGYFPALYRNVTLSARQGLTDGSFEDPERMARLIILFANRYLEAYDLYAAGRSPTRSWQVAFDATRSWWPIVLQHLLLSMNAHINVDLGIAAARASPGDSFQDMKPDFDRINDLLAGMVDGVSRNLVEVWPLLRLLDWIAGRTDEVIINFKMKKAREAAWQVAVELAPLDATAQLSVIERLDRDITQLGVHIRNPGLRVGAVLAVVRLGERGTVSEIIGILGRKATEVRRALF